MLPRVSNVESIVVSDRAGNQEVVDFQKVIHFNSRYYLLVSCESKFVFLRAEYKDDNALLYPLQENERQILQQVLPLTGDYESQIPTLACPYVVSGMTYNSMNSPIRSTTKFVIAGGSRTIDLLPYVLQTGADHVMFLDEN